jgi:hypothetical protein
MATTTKKKTTTTVSDIDVANDAVLAATAAKEVAEAAQSAIADLKLDLREISTIQKGVVATLPTLREDIREIREGQGHMVSTLTSVMTELIGTHAKTEETWQKATDGTLAEIKGHMEKQNGRIAKAEKHITRQNLVLFGIVGPLTLGIIVTVLGYFVHAYILAHNIFQQVGAAIK